MYALDGFAPLTLPWLNDASVFAFLVDPPPRPERAAPNPPNRDQLRIAELTQANRFLVQRNGEMAAALTLASGRLDEAANMFGGLTMPTLVNAMRRAAEAAASAAAIDAPILDAAA